MGIKESPTNKGKPKVGFDFHAGTWHDFISTIPFYYVTVTTWYFPIDFNVFLMMSCVK